MIWIARTIAAPGEDLLERLSRSDLRDRLSSAIERVEGACGNDIERFCSDITPGGGRIASCMQAYSDQLSRRCQFTLRHAVNRVQQAVENIADTCMTAVQQQCGDTDNVRQLRAAEALIPPAILPDHRRGRAGRTGVSRTGVSSQGARAGRAGSSASRPASAGSEGHARFQL